MDNVGLLFDGFATALQPEYLLFAFIGVLLGTAVTPDRIRAKLAGYAMHFLFGLLFFVPFVRIFEAAYLFKSKPYRSRWSGVIFNSTPICALNWYMLSS